MPDTSTVPRASLVDPRLSVNDVLRRWPSAIGALDAFGIDTCCGGASSLEAAAAEAGVALDDVLLAVQASVPREAPHAGMAR